MACDWREFAPLSDDPDPLDAVEHMVTRWMPSEGTRDAIIAAIREERRRRATRRLSPLLLELAERFEALTGEALEDGRASMGTRVALDGLGQTIRALVGTAASEGES